MEEKVVSQSGEQQSNDQSALSVRPKLRVVAALGNITRVKAPVVVVGSYKGIAPTSAVDDDALQFAEVFYERALDGNFWEMLSQLPARKSSNQAPLGAHTSITVNLTRVLLKKPRAGDNYGSEDEKDWDSQKSRPAKEGH